MPPGPHGGAESHLQHHPRRWHKVDFLSSRPAAVGRVDKVTPHRHITAVDLFTSGTLIHLCSAGHLTICTWTHAAQRESSEVEDWTKKTLENSCISQVYFRKQAGRRISRVGGWKQKSGRFSNAHTHTTAQSGWWEQFDRNRRNMLIQLLIAIK